MGKTGGSSTTPLPNRKEFIRGFLQAIGSDDETTQRILAEEMGVGYQSGVGEAIFALVGARPDIAYAVTRLSQHNARLHRLYLFELRNLLRYLYETCTDGIYYWWLQANKFLPAVAPPRINSNMHDLLLDVRPVH